MTSDPTCGCDTSTLTTAFKTSKRCAGVKDMPEPAAIFKIQLAGLGDAYFHNVKPSMEGRAHTCVALA